MSHPAGEESELTSSLKVQKRWHVEAGTQSRHGDNETSMTFHLWYTSRPFSAIIIGEPHNTPAIRQSHIIADSRGKPMSAGHFLPTDDENLEDLHWAITSKSNDPSHSACNARCVVIVAGSQYLMHFRDEGGATRSSTSVRWRR